MRHAKYRLLSCQITFKYQLHALDLLVRIKVLYNSICTTHRKYLLLNCQIALHQQRSLDLPLNLHNHEQLPNIELPDRPQTPVTRSRFATMVQSPLKLNLPYPKQVPDAELQDCPQTPITKSRLATLE